MGYSLSQFSVKTYTPTDDIVAQNIPTTNASALAYTKVKEMKIVSLIGTTSLFRFNMTLWNTSGVKTTTGLIYKNGIAVGTPQEVVGNVPTVKTEDIIVSNWEIDDTIELWIKTSDAAWAAFTKDFQLCGVGSEFMNTLV